MKTIVVAVDFSKGTDYVLGAASKLAKALNEQVYLVHSVDNSAIYGTYGLYAEHVPAMAEYGEMARNVAICQLNELKEKLSSANIAVSCEILDGRPSEAIIEFSEQVGADMVIVGTHGHSAIGSLLMGSVASSLTRCAKIPVLVVPCGEEVTKIES